MKKNTNRVIIYLIILSFFLSCSRLNYNSSIEFIQLTDSLLYEPNVFSKKHIYVDSSMYSSLDPYMLKNKKYIKQLKEYIKNENNKLKLRKRVVLTLGFKDCMNNKYIISEYRIKDKFRSDSAFSLLIGEKWILYVFEIKNDSLCHLRTDKNW